MHPRKRAQRHMRMPVPSKSSLVLSLRLLEPYSPMPHRIEILGLRCFPVETCLSILPASTVINFARHVAGQCHSLPESKYFETLAQKIIGKNERGAEFSIACRPAALRNAGTRGFLRAIHKNARMSTCFLIIQVYSHALTSLSIISLLPSIPIPSPLRVASFHILVRSNISLIFRSDELPPNAQLDSPFFALSSFLTFSFALVTISRAIFRDLLSSVLPSVTLVASQVAQVEFCIRPKQQTLVDDHIIIKRITDVLLLFFFLLESKKLRWGKWRRWAATQICNPRCLLALLSRVELLEYCNLKLCLQPS
jgi:hypothetical protein